MLSPVLILALEAAGFLGDATKRTNQEERQPGEPPKIRLTLALRGMGGMMVREGPRQPIEGFGDTGISPCKTSCPHPSVCRAQVLHSNSL